jgi:hypothetical protein
MARLLILVTLLISIKVLATEPIVMIMVDGARPDYVNHLVEHGELANIKRYFYDEGTVYQNSFTTLSLTVPSWSTILSGKDIDRTAIKGNDIFNRNTKHIENYLDWRRDILWPEYREHGRAYRLLRDGGNKTMLDYFKRPLHDNYGDDSEVFASFFPLNDKFPTYLFATALNNLLHLDTAKKNNVHEALIALMYEDKNFLAIDRDSAEQVKEVLNSNGPMKKLILLYFSAVDHYTHTEHGKGLDTLKKIDLEIGEVLRTIKRSRYHNSTVVLVSDHGSQGGKEFDSPNSHHPLKGQTYGLTPTNLNYILTGWYNIPGMDQYGFNVTSTFAAEGKFSLRSFPEFQAHPFQCTNLARVLNLSGNSCSGGEVHAGITTSQTIAIPFASAYSNNWKAKNNWYTLTNYEVSKGVTRNILRDLETFEIPNAKAAVSKFPLDWLVISVSMDEFNSSQTGITAERDLLLVHHSDNSQALILSRDINGSPEYRYVPIKNFRQNASGHISFSLNDASDPFGYLRSPWVDRMASGNFADDQKWFREFHSAREWAARYSQTSYPNTVAAAYRTFYYRQEGLKLQDAERFDILLNPKYGHIFTVENDDLESNHGMFQRESVRNSFMIRGPSVRQGYQHLEPVFATDVLPTVFRSSGNVVPSDLDGHSIESTFH